MNKSNYKKTFTIFLLLIAFCSCNLFAQSTPPFGKRGTYLDCSADLVDQIHQGNSIVATDYLDQLKSKNFNYIALFGLDHTPNTVSFPLGYVLGDPSFEPDINFLVTEAHYRGITVGVVVSDKDFISRTYTMPIDWSNLILRSDCLPPIAQRIANPEENSSFREHLMSELVKAGIRAANYNSNRSYVGGYIDYISVEFEYWTTQFYVDHAAEYMDDAIESKEHKAYADLLFLLNYVRERIICSGRYAKLRSEWNFV